MSDAASAGKKLAVVSGASSGIGRATAIQLGKKGWRVVLVARGKDALEAVAKEVSAGGGQGIVEACDASDGDAVLAMAKRVLEAHGAPDAVVNSAGLGEWRFIEDSGPADAKRMMGAPFFAAYHLTHAFMAAMLARRKGVFVHVGSPASLMPWARATAYVSSRWALRGLHEALRMDLVGTGLQSCHVVLGKVTSEYFERNPDSEAYIPGIASVIPVSTPDQAAAVVVSAIERPRAQILRPFTLLAFRWMQVVAPWLVRWFVVLTGARHSPR